MVKRVINHFQKCMVQYYQIKIIAIFQRRIWDPKAPKMEFIVALHRNIKVNNRNNRNTRTGYELCWTIKTPEWFSEVVMVSLLSSSIWRYFTPCSILFYCWLWTSKCPLQESSILDVVQILKVRLWLLIYYLDSVVQRIYSREIR